MENKQNNTKKAKKEVKVREKLGTLIVCKHCGRTFTKKYNTHFYCSEECRHEVEKVQWRERSKRYRARKKQKQMEQQLAQQQVNDTAVTTDTTDRCDN